MQSYKFPMPVYFAGGTCNNIQDLTRISHYLIKLLCWQLLDFITVNAVFVFIFVHFRVLECLLMYMYGSY